jgi:4-hydroxymandelate oxidase
MKPAAVPTEQKLVNLHDFESAANALLGLTAREYLASGAADEITLRRNRTAFATVHLAPRTMVDVSALDTTIELLGETHPSPALIAPTGYHGLFHPEGERETARGAAAAGATLVVSTFSTTSIEEIARAAPARLWFQLYVQRGREHTRRLVERAEAAGASVLVVTVDTPVLGTRDRERRLEFPVGQAMRAVLLDELDPEGTKRHQTERDSIYSPLLAPNLTWDEIERIRSTTRLPVVLKGVLSPEDAARAAGAGVAGLIVSNHGGRNLDTAPATIEALPRIVDAVGARVPVLLDGGVRRGTDVLKALALGARAVLIGRPALWGLAVGGAGGVKTVLDTLRLELMSAMALCGVPSARGADRSLLWEK